MNTTVCNHADFNRSDFPTLDEDIGEDGAVRPFRVRRVCIAASDILGPVKNGGIGTAYHHVARFLAARGHEVTIAYVNYNAEDSDLMTETEAFYAGFGVGFEAIVPRATVETELARVSAPGWALLEWLRAQARPFDLVHVSESRGLGYGALLAKFLGISFGSTHFVVKGSSPTLWQGEGNHQLVSTERELGWVFMERRSVELADTVICGSAHLLQWMHEAGYALPARTFVWPNVFPAPECSPEAVAERAQRDGVRLEEVVFFGRLEPRKGLVLFIDAIDRLVRQGRAPGRVTFLGSVSRRIYGPGLIRDASRGWPVEVRTLTDHGSAEAVAYLSRPGRLAVIPSLLENSSIAVMECLHAGIPFVAAATGGTPELVAEADRARALVAAEHIALGERIAELSAAGLRAVRPRWDFERSLQVWGRWHAQEAPFEASAEHYAQRTHHAQAETPVVTVCIVHHERPELVRMAVDSVYGQDYPAIEAVLVDDGSEGAEALAALAGIEAEFAERGWRVVRQENRYPGAARNAAAAAARGQWLLFLDDDNVLFPDAVTRLVRAARFSGADCVPAASIRFFGEGDPRTDPDSHGGPIRFLGAARAWCRFANVVGDVCALVRREVFEASGGFAEEYRGGGLEDLSFFNQVMQGGYRIEPLPDPVYYYRFGKTSIKSRHRSAQTGQLRVVAPYLAGQNAEERASIIHSVAQREIAKCDAHRYRAELAMRRHDWDVACELWDEARRLFPGHPSGFIRGAAALLEAGRLDECEPIASEAMERFPEALDAHYHRAELAMRRRDWNAACKRWSEVRRLFPDDPSGFIRGAAALLEAGRLDECEPVSREAVERFPERFEARYHRAELAMRRHDWDVACKRWSEVRRLFPDDPSGFIRGAAALLEAGRLDECEPISREAVERFPERSEAHYHQAELIKRRREAPWIPVGRTSNFWHGAASRLAPSWWGGRRVVGAVENRDRLQVRGWLLDPAEPGRRRRVAIHAQESLRAVVVAEGWRDDVARRKGTDGHHGFLWSIPQTLAGVQGLRIDIFDAETGRPLRGSPVRVEGERVVANRRRRWWG